MPSRRKQWVILSVLTLIFGLPFILAWYAYFYGGNLGWRGHTNRGELLTPPSHISTLNLHDYDQQRDMATKGRWTIAYIAPSCDETCLAVLDRLARVRLALGKEMYRTQAWLATVQQLDTEQRQKMHDAIFSDVTLKLGLASAFDDSRAFRHDKSIILIDPNGNMMMGYDTDVAAKDIYDDMKHLLTLSNIG